MSHIDRFKLSFDEDTYPDQLRSSPDPPKILYGIGDPHALTVGLAVVGSRRATPYGLGATRTFAGWAARSGYVVISGGARGCDQAAHLAALECHGCTVAVMGCGADVAYPTSAHELLHRITQNGAVVSEFPWGTLPKPWMFRRRNRIIAGLSGAVLVVEAGLPSGTFSTADEALSAGRDVLAVPGAITSPGSRGANRLIRQGATPVTEVSELQQELLASIGEPHTTLAQPARSQVDVADELLAALLAEPLRPDDAARSLGLDIVTVSRRLGVLESAGRIARYADGRYGPR